MSISRRSWKKAVLAAAGSALVLAPMAAAPAAQADTQATLTTIATGLANPRGITVQGDGSVLVAESGSADPTCTANAVAGQICFGLTGSIYKVSANGWQGRVATGLPSMAKIYAPGGPVIASGPAAVKKDSNGGYDVLSNYGGTDSTRAALGTGAANLGTWYRTRDNVQMNDPVHFETVNNPDGADTWSNAYRFIADGSDYLATDAAANDVVRMHPDGTTTLEYVIPTNVNPATGASVQSVPTGIARGWDGSIYIADMSGEVSGQARIWKVTPGGQPQVFATGMSNLVDLAVDASGNLLALSYSTSYPTGAGALYHVDTTTGAVTTVNTGTQLVHPTGIAVSPCGTVYVANNGATTSGQLVKVSF